MTNKQIAAVLNRDLSYTMRVFLDKRRGTDLIQAAHDFAQYFQLSTAQAGELIQVWMDLPVESESL